MNITEIKLPNASHTIAEAIKIAESNNKTDEWWSYEVVIRNEHLAYVLVRDEDGVEIGTL